MLDYSCLKLLKTVEKCLMYKTTWHCCMHSLSRCQAQKHAIGKGTICVWLTYASDDWCAQTACSQMHRDKNRDV